MTPTISLLQQLIAIPSISGDEAAILQFCQQWLGEHGVSEVITQPQFTAGVVRANSNQPARKALILCGHIDTVAAGDEAAWTDSPWQARIDGGRLYGLGASDMKAGVAAQMTAVATYAQTPRPDLDVWCVQVAHEEVDGAGSAAFVQYFAQQTDYDEISCLIAEPTDMGRIEIGHRGNRFVEFLFHGESGHASQEEHYSTSALPAVVNFLQQLPALREQLHSTYADPVLGQPSFTPTRISPEGAFSNNQTAAASLVAVDIRTTPRLDAVFDDWMGQVATEYGATWRYAADPAPSALCATDAPIVRALQSLTPDAAITVSPAATDQAFFQSRGINTVVFGPGDFDQAHTIDESVSMQATEQAQQIYRNLLQVY
ncbi:MAG: M20/M25/M40 family metallo-hydrolase [Candidatus Saccharibacteria bacterium]|nr:M20/M25/M40 family metallo-hydrolase [Candidatus Saccharibacteria bacterium]